MQSMYHIPETMPSVQQPSLQHRMNRWPSEQCVGAMTSARGNDYMKIKCHRKFRRYSIGSADGPEVVAAVSERPTATSERRVTGRTDALCTGSSYAYAENWPTASNGSLDMVAYIYMCSPGHLKFAGVPRHHTHIQEHLQAI